VLRRAVVQLGFWLGVALGAGPALALPMDYTISLDLADATSRNVIVWFEQSDADAPMNTPGVLDTEWSGRIAATYSSDGTTAIVTVDGADFEPVVTAAGFAPQAGTFSDYVFQIDVATGDFTGAFTGTVTLDGRDVDWDSDIDSTLTAGYDSMVKTVMDTNVNYWKYCEMGMNCVTVAGPVGTNVWSMLDDFGMTQVVNAFSPFGETAFGEIPEPETFVLMGTGLIGLGLFSRRRVRAG
jgi:hypothetical protein